MDDSPSTIVLPTVYIITTHFSSVVALMTSANTTNYIACRTKSDSIAFTATNATNTVVVELSKQQ